MKKNKKWLGSKKAVKRKSSRVSPMAHNRRVRKLVLHNEGADRNGAGDPVWLAEYVRGKGIEYHAVINLETGKFVQLLPFDAAARSLLNAGLDGGIGDNRSGDVCIQICVQGYGSKPFTAGRMRGAEVLGEICDAWGIPHKVRKKWGPGASRSTAEWNKSGIHGHCHAPGNDHTDPGPIDVKKLKAAMWPKKKKRGRG